MDNRLSELLEDKGLSDWDNSERPSTWTSYIPMFLVTGFCVAAIV